MNSANCALRLLCFLLITQCLFSQEQYAPPAGNAGESKLLKTAREYFFRGALKNGITTVDSVLKNDPDDQHALYLKGEYCCLAGKKEVLEVLRRIKDEYYADLLDLKIDLLLGDRRFPDKLRKLREKYPSSAELEFAGWLYKTEHGGLEEAKKDLWQLSDKLVFGFLPSRHLYILTEASDAQYAASLLHEASKRGFAWTKRVDRKPQLKPEQVFSSSIYETELPLIDCGPYMGIELRDSLGNIVRASLDTGTSGFGLTIHSRTKGDSLCGVLLDTVRNGIQYRYMSAPADLYYKLCSFSWPDARNMLVGYFEGGLPASDGVFSPFAFKDLAITIDSKNRKVFLRSRQALKKYLSGKNNYESLDFIRRGGWIYVPGKIDTSEVLMMVETGSRDVNLNKIAQLRYDTPVIEDSIEWRGKTYPVTRPVFKLRLGSLEYEPEDALVDEFVLGNYYTGVASAGDIGPDFLRNYTFTIDPFESRLILEKP